MKKHFAQAQTVIEYVMVISIVTLALVAMTPGVKRGIQMVVKVIADQVGNQVNSEQTNRIYFGGEQEGYLEGSRSVTGLSQSKTKLEHGDYVSEYSFQDTTTTSSQTNTYLGTANMMGKY